MEEVCNPRGQRLTHREKSRSRVPTLDAVITVSRRGRVRNSDYLSRIKPTDTPLSRPIPLILQWVKGQVSITRCNVLRGMTLRIVISRVSRLGEGSLNLRWTTSGDQVRVDAVERHTRLGEL